MAVAFTAKCGLKTNGKQMGKQSYAAESRIMHAAETMEGPVISSSTDWPEEPKLYADVGGVVLLVCIKIKLSSKCCFFFPTIFLFVLYLTAFKEEKHLYISQFCLINLP